MTDRSTVSELLQPKTFRFGIGGYTGDSYEVSWNGATLEYRSYTRGFEPRDTLQVDPTPHKWRLFWRWLNQNDLWSWPEVCEGDTPLADGTSWSVHIEIGDRCMRSSGANAYPGATGAHPSPVFNRFLAALRRLLGGLELR
jgi:hypothetical protein